ELRRIKKLYAEPGECIDVRLQVQSDGWTVHFGDSSYDQDHRGFWGASCIVTTSNCREVARDLIEQAKDHEAQCSDEEDEPADDEDVEPDEIDDGDYVTMDHQDFYQYGRLVLSVGVDDDHKPD